MTLIQELTDLPLVIDSSIIEVLEAGLAAYQGKALVNSVTAEDERLEAILPLVRKYGAAVIGLPNDEEEIPESRPAGSTWPASSSTSPPSGTRSPSRTSSSTRWPCRSARTPCTRPGRSRPSR